jgi:hypothetical protein
MSGTVYSGSTSPTSYADDGGIYGGAISSGSGGPTTGRAPQVGRNSIYMPGFNNVDFRITRNIPIHDNISMQIVGEAFNLLNHNIITGVVGTYSQYANSVVPTTAVPNPVCNSTASAPAGSVMQGCISPFTGTGLNAFKATSGSNNSLVGPRQLQLSAKFTF